MKFAAFATGIFASTTFAFNLVDQDQSTLIMEPEEYLLGETWTDVEASAQPWYTGTPFEYNSTRYLRKLGAVRQELGALIRDSVSSTECGV